MSYSRTKVWVWFKDGLDGGECRGGFYAADNAEHEEAVTLHRRDLPIHQNHPSNTVTKSNLCIGFCLCPWLSSGLLVDGFDQYLTYYELGFELLSLLVVLVVLLKNRT